MIHPYLDISGTFFCIENKSDDFKDNLPQFEQFIVKNLNGFTYLSGSNEPKMIDLHIIPFLERILMLENSPFQ